MRQSIQQGLSQLLSVLDQYGVLAAVTTTAGFSHLTNSQQQGLLAAIGTFGNRFHPPQLAGSAIATLTHRPSQAAAVSIGIEQQHLSRFTVTARSARFLQIALRAGGKLQMQHQAHIRAVNPHAKGHRGHQHRLRFFLKLLQGQQATLRVHAGVISEGR